MKKCIWIIPLFFFLLISAAEKRGEASTNIYIETKENTALFDMISGERVTVGQLVKGQIVQTIDEDESYYYILYGNGKAYVSKASVEVTQKREPIGKRRYSNQVVITEKNVTVISDTRSGKELGFLSRNMRYPVTGTYKKHWYTIQLGGRTGYIHKDHVRNDDGIPVLMYHHILKDSENRYFKNHMTISLKSFQQQLDYLKKNGYRTIFLNDLENYMRYRSNLTGRTVAITFDDGLKSAAIYAYPELKKRGFIATNFLIADRIWKTDYAFNPDRLQQLSMRDLEQSADVFRYESHTASMHLRDKQTNIPFLVMKGFNDIAKDLVKSREIIGSHVKYLAYPFGQYDQETIKAAQAAQITMAFTTEPGRVMLGDHRYKLKRQGVSPVTSMKDFMNKVE
ncbi:polysaccharide deacetylase family protein [Cytobacillus spongiae]|uniref:polysaccharide deacetylase family protein n=1 Tax=Cytobacillus spongiae TaxID=2901381 RepID=UPI001F1A4F04|nr:polysaccharide deacetylase family protein [Cytobacillus spongiae]UII55643.1 polysaccharide deacetylase family protein [Cytobacillus spongiae]